MKTMGFSDEVKKSNSTPVKHFSTGDVTCPVIALWGLSWYEKTSSTVSLVCDSAKPIFYRLVPQFSSHYMLTDRLYVYTGKSTDHMEARIKLKDKETLVDTLYNSIVDGIRDKIRCFGIDYLMERPCYHRKITSYVPARYKEVFNFLGRTCGDYNLGLHNFEQAAQECNYKMDQFPEIFISLIEDGLRKYIEDGVVRIYSQFCDVFGSYTSDDIITVDIDLNNPDEEKTDSLFNCDTHDGSGFEIICDLITTYVPMNEQVKVYISENPIYRDADGEVSFAFFNTKGTFATRWGVSPSLSSISSKCDAVAFVVPLSFAYLDVYTYEHLLSDLEDFSKSVQQNGSNGGDLPVFFLYNNAYAVIWANAQNLYRVTEDPEEFIASRINLIWKNIEFDVSPMSYPYFVCDAHEYVCNINQGDTKYAFSNVAKDFLTSVAERIKR